MPKYINVDILETELRKLVDETDCNISIMPDVFSTLSEQPIAKVKEDIRGEWEYIPLNVMDDRYGMNKYNTRIKCTACGFVTSADFFGHYYCHCCGADMRGEQEGEK